MAVNKKLSKKHHYKENNKLLIILFIFLTFVLLLVYLTIDIKKSKYTLKQMQKDVSAASVMIPDASVSAKLIDGKAGFEIDGSEGMVEVTPPLFSYKTNDGYDVFAVMTHSTGGSGEFVSIAYFKKNDSGLEFQKSYPVGDRVIVNDITKGNNSSTGYEINVSYLDRLPNTPMAEPPTIESNIVFSVTD